MRMRELTDIFVTFVLCAMLAGASSRSQFQHYKNEGHGIMKRMAEGEEIFEQHDVATVHLMESQGQRKKRMAKKDLRMLGNSGIASRLQLSLSSGSKLNLALTPAAIGNPETVVSYHTEKGYEEGKRIASDCYFYGHMTDSTGTGWAAISHCDGVFGFASSQAYEYFLHPVASRRSKRNTGEDFDVHVMWRRAPSYMSDNITLSHVSGKNKYGVENESPDNKYEDGMLEAYTDNNDNATSIVIEMAMFSDERYWRRLVNSYPGREDDFLLTRLAGTQALYSDRKKIGYDVKIKLKFLEYWKTDPANYTFTDDLPSNLRSFCQYTTNNINDNRYDIHALNTGILKWNSGRIGFAVVGGICTRRRCFTVKGIEFKTFIGFAHELGHTLGLSHRNTINCPPELDSNGGFMGGGSFLLFSECMKHKLSLFIGLGKGSCLFTEAAQSKTPIDYQSVPSVFPGQSKTPDQLCRILAGPGYKYLPNEQRKGMNVCLWFVCLNENENSPEFLRAKKFFAPFGFPCKDEAFCQMDQCKLWNKVKMTPKFETLKNLTQEPQWTEWSEISACSRSCGTGVKFRRRECQYSGLNLAPYCPGMSFKPKLCNVHPCEGEPTTLAALRHLRRDEVCARFFHNNVRLSLKKAKAYLPKGSSITPDDTGPNIRVGHSESCLMKCVRDPKSAKGDLDAVLPDGTLCVDYRRPYSDLDRLNIQMRCLRGYCHEFSDCPDGRQIKDDCGICDGDGSRCFNLTVNPLDLDKHQHSELTLIPSCSTNIDAYFDRSKGTGIILELWSHDDRNIIGEGGQYPKAVYEGSHAVTFAGTNWTYRPHEAYLRAPGPTNEDVIIKAMRKANGVKKLTIHYAKCV